MKISKTLLIAGLLLTLAAACDFKDGGNNDKSINHKVNQNIITPNSASTSKPTATPNEIWIDPESGLTWQVKPTSERDITWVMAKLYCENLKLGGYEDWRLPTISELRSLIRGCPASVTGSGCMVTDSCLNIDCWVQGECTGCSRGDGPGMNGMYWPTELSSGYGVSDYYWSSSSVTIPGRAWFVCFGSGDVGYYFKHDKFCNARCVR